MLRMRVVINLPRLAFPVRSVATCSLPRSLVKPPQSPSSSPPTPPTSHTSSPASHQRANKHARGVAVTKDFSKTRVFVQNIPLSIDWRSLKDHFRDSLGPDHPIAYASVSREQTTGSSGHGTSKGHGLVDFENASSADFAIAKMRNFPITAYAEEHSLYVRFDVQEQGRRSNSNRNERRNSSSNNNSRRNFSTFRTTPTPTPNLNLNPTYSQARWIDSVLQKKLLSELFRLLAFPLTHSENLEAEAEAETNSNSLEYPTSSSEVSDLLEEILLLHHFGLVQIVAFKDWNEMLSRATKIPYQSQQSEGSVGEAQLAALHSRIVEHMWEHSYNGQLYNGDEDDEDDDDDDDYDDNNDDNTNYDKFDMDDPNSYPSLFPRSYSILLQPDVSLPSFFGPNESDSDRVEVVSSMIATKLRISKKNPSHCPPPTNQQYQFLTHTLAKGRNSRGALAVLNQMERRDKIIPSEINIVNAIRSCVESGRFDEAVFMLNEVERKSGKCLDESVTPPEDNRRDLAFRYEDSDTQKTRDMKKYVNKWNKNIESWLADGDPSNTTMTLASGDGFKRRVMYGEIQRRFPGLGTFKVDGDRIRIFAEETKKDCARTQRFPKLTLDMFRPVIRGLLNDGVQEEKRLIRLLSGGEEDGAEIDEDNLTMKLNEKIDVGKLGFHINTRGGGSSASVADQLATHYQKNHSVVVSLSRYAQQKGIELDPAAFTTLVKSCELAGDGDLAEEVLGELVVLEKPFGGIQNPQPFNFTINAIMRSGRETAVADCLQILETVEEGGRGAGCSPDKYTYGCILRGLATRGEAAEALKIFDRILDNGKAGEGLMNWKNKLMSTASVNSVIWACMNSNQAEFEAEGLDILKKLAGGAYSHGWSKGKAEPVYPQVQTFAGVIRSLGKSGGGGIERARKCASVLDAMRNGEEWCGQMLPSVECYNGVIAACYPAEDARWTDWSEEEQNEYDRRYENYRDELGELRLLARQVLTNLEEDGNCKPTRASYERVMKTCEYGRNVEGMIEMFDKLEQSDFKVTRKNVLTLANSLMDNRPFEEANGLLLKYEDLVNE